MIVARGALEAEQRLLELVDELAPAGPDELARPLRVVVPSSSLRLHVSRRLVAGGARVGVTVATLHGVALEILERAGRPRPAGEAAFEVLARRLTATEPALVDALGGLADGFGAALPALRDLLDAGHGPELEGAILERIEELAAVAPAGAVERARAAVRVASGIDEGLRRLGATRTREAARLATDALFELGGVLLPSAAVIVHGFADATGLATDLVRALLATLGGVLLLDRPPDPADPARDDAGAVFLERFASHFGGLPASAAGAQSRCSAAAAFCAPDQESEAREVATRIRTLLDRGACPEEVAVVARDPARVARRLGRHFERLGVPYSALSTTLAGGGAARRASFLGRLLDEGSEAPAEVWSEAAAGVSGQVALGLRVVGVSRLVEVGELARAASRREGIPLRDRGHGDEDAGCRLSAREARAAVARVSVVCRLVEEWPAEATVERHLERTLEAIEALGWAEDDAAEPRAALEAIAGELPAGWVLRRREWVRLARGRLAHVGEAAPGGVGGGVQLLGVMEARARTFAHLFLVDLVRGVFPRTIHDDFLLPDLVRARLAADVLPEMPIKARGLDEERYLFAQVLSSAPTVTLSWSAGVDGRPAVPSPLAERLRRLGAIAIATPGGVRIGERGVSMAAYERARIAEEASPASAAVLVAAALEEGEDRHLGGRSGIDLEALARARLAVVEERERKPSPGHAGPWAGLVGGGASPGSLWVTELERLAECPFRHFVTRRLGVAPMPDPGAGLPEGVGPPLGSVIHRVLEMAARRCLESSPETVEAALDAPANELSWPSEEELEALLEEAAERVARREGLELAGIAPLLLARARLLVAVGRDCWRTAAESGRRLVGVEVEGALEGVGGGAEVRFRADRVDRERDGRLVLVDYKSGKPLSDARTANKRAEHLRKRVAAGRALQAAVYARATGGLGEYLYLKPEIRDAPAEARALIADGGDSALAGVLENALEVLVEARRLGLAFARVEDRVAAPKNEREKENGACRHCRVAEACLRNDTAVRRGLVAWLDGEGLGDRPEVAVARALWRLGAGAADGS